MRPKIDRICKACSTVFHGHKSRRYCSVYCRNSIYRPSPRKGKKGFKGKPRNRINKVCAVCSKEFEVWAGRPTAKWCSKACWSVRKPKEVMECTNCKIGFVDWRSNRKDTVFCGKRCANSYNRRGEKSEFWKGGVTATHQIIRTSYQYKDWRKAVYERDNYTCVWCGVRSGNGKRVLLNADHIKPFAYYPELRFEVSNGRTLCHSCHLKTDTFGTKARLAAVNPTLSV